jgi:hypothetical protein
MGVIQGQLDFSKVIKGLLPKQKEFLSCRERYVDYTGGFGSGKTVILCTTAITHGQLVPGGEFLVGRLNFPALNRTTRKTFLELMPEEYVASWKPSEQTLYLKNDSIYYFTHLDMAEADLKSHLRSLNLTGFYLDEGSEIPKDVFLDLSGRLRNAARALDGKDNHFGRTSGNPAGRDWRWKLFHDPDRDAPARKRYVGITAPTTENTHLPPDYIEDLHMTLPADWQERFIYGSFADFAELVYKDFDYKLHVWNSKDQWEVFEGRSLPPPNWPVIVGVDIGGVDPWGIVFIAIQPVTGYLYVFDEIYQAGILVQEIADRYYGIMGTKILDGMAYDYENQQAAMELAEFGVIGTPAIKAVDAGIFKVGQYLHPDDRILNPFNGKMRSPRLFIASHCTHAIEEISTYKWAKDRTGDMTGKPADGNDHIMDALRYCIHTFRPLPVKGRDPEKWETPGLDPLSKLYWYEVTKWEKKNKPSGSRMRFGGRLGTRML